MTALVLIALLLVSCGILVLTRYLSFRFTTDIVGEIVAIMFVVHALVALLALEILPAEYVYLDTLGPFGFFYGPLFYFSLSSFNESRKDLFYKRMVFHAIPFSGATLFYLVCVFSPSTRYYLGEEIILVWYLLLCISWFIYIGLSIVLLIRKKVNKKVYKVNAKSFVLFSVIVCFIALTLLSNIQNDEIQPTSSGSLIVFTFMLIHSLLWYNYLLGRVKEEKEIQTSEEAYFSSKILDIIEDVPSEEEVKEDEQLGVHMIVLEKPGNILEKINFQDMNNTLTKQAALLGIHAPELSQMIKEETGMSYSNFINKKRIDHAVSLLVKNKDINMDELMRASGFSSKSSFYRNFKKFTDHSPLEYIQQVLK